MFAEYVDVVTFAGIRNQWSLKSISEIYFLFLREPRGQDKVMFSGNAV